MPSLLGLVPSRSRMQSAIAVRYYQLSYRYIGEDWIIIGREGVIILSSLNRGCGLSGVLNPIRHSNT